MNKTQRINKQWPDFSFLYSLFYRHKYEVREIYPFSPSIKYDLQNASHHRIH